MLFCFALVCPVEIKKNQGHEQRTDFLFLGGGGKFSCWEELANVKLKLKILSLEYIFTNLNHLETNIFQ